MDVPKRDSMKFLKWASRRKQFAPIRDRIRAVILARRRKTLAEIAAQLEYCTRWVQKWVARYRAGGLDGLWDKPRSGAPKHLRSDQEEAFLERISQGPKPEDQISIFHGHHIQKILKAEFDASYSLDGVYSLLARLRLSWITARPCHEQNDPEKMEEWKKAFKAKLKEIKKNIRGKTSKCGFKMKPDTVSRGTCIESGQKKVFDLEG